MKVLRRISGPAYENDLGWRLRHNAALCEMLDRPRIVKYDQIKILQWAGRVVVIDNPRIPKIGT